MTYKRNVVQQKVKKAGVTVPNSDRFRTNEEIIKEDEARQAEIDKWNNNKEIDPRFKDIQIAGAYVIVRLFKENYIKSVLETLDDGTKIYEAYIGQVEIQRIGQNKRSWTDNPLPYVFKGIIQAISPEVAAEQLEKQKKCAEQGVEFKTINVGDTVGLEWFDLQRNRYYPDKQKIDLIKDPKEYSVDNYEGLVRVHYTQIESIYNNG